MYDSINIFILFCAIQSIYYDFYISMRTIDENLSNIIGKGEEITLFVKYFLRILFVLNRILIEFCINKWIKIIIINT